MANFKATCVTNLQGTNGLHSAKLRNTATNYELEIYSDQMFVVGDEYAVAITEGKPNPAETPAKPSQPIAAQPQPQPQPAKPGFGVSQPK